jgi:flagellar biogenesis protein FliO
MTKELDPKKYVSLGVQPEDLKALSAVDIAWLDQRLTETDEQSAQRLLTGFEKAMEKRLSDGV